MSPDLVATLIAASEQAGYDSTVDAILLTGSDPGFCAGSDLAELARMDSAGRRRFEAESGRLARMFGALPKPIVAAVKGFAIGGGLTLATSCDIVVTEAIARWNLPEVPIGLFPAWGLASVTNRVGLPMARRLAWGIETLSGAEAVRLGLADHLAEGDVLDYALLLARKLAELPAAQAAAVKTYFQANPSGEAADLLANRLFMSMCETNAATLTFGKFAKRGG
jgi:enoyl-CoA hydratase/carnithine racemase